ncbi:MULTISPECIES: 30S ribosomal protein S20 [Desulfococcus]|uniref:Small ribosomal subunit protein bS20 n=1 Tax=Desulfococcus multivorans DSM 2059 TaxID=1121405 RepID=S7TBZ5_DESML|nr:30S ribosomal protein S20 [Desulfococcus multivorans]AOY58899.1 RpsT: 30S ribosomal protein S20 [Desulfococcus multivorans]AQV01178.1 30S ribosomal protein S20 [Desulfococcus multivorans]EPR34065.1 30S ribosomal protein S20 [Desulfococcus multivorans DSM 2059]MDX9818322.1 30S ribosomal protein S20 [Desulfococcus multivorans]SJZ52833.1 SSU ribosomal protein S20P [Desulfococcus multivorans DSM 2059]
MANHKSALKRARQNVLRRERNRIVRTRMKNAVKQVRSAANENSKDAAVEHLNQAKSVIAKAAKKGVIHRNTAARKISRLAKLVNTVSL